MNVKITYCMPDDREEFEAAYNALDYKFTLQDFDNFLRNGCKYGESDTIEWEVVRDKLHDILNDRELSIWG